MRSSCIFDNLIHVFTKNIIIAYCLHLIHVLVIQGEEQAVLDDEPVVSSGVGAALELAKKKGVWGISLLFYHQALDIFRNTGSQQIFVNLCDVMINSLCLQATLKMKKRSWQEPGEVRPRRSWRSRITP